jgi:hypothetical protein
MNYDSFLIILSLDITGSSALPSLFIQKRIECFMTNNPPVQKKYRLFDTKINPRSVDNHEISQMPLPQTYAAQ